MQDDSFILNFQAYLFYDEFSAYVLAWGYYIGDYQPKVLVLAPGGPSLPLLPTNHTCEWLMTLP